MQIDNCFTTTVIDSDQKVGDSNPSRSTISHLRAVERFSPGPTPPTLPATPPAAALSQQTPGGYPAWPESCLDRSHRTASRGCVILISSHQYRAGKPPSRGKNRCRKSRDRSSGTCSLPQKRWPCRCGCSSRPCWRRQGIPGRSSRGSSHRPGCPSIFRPGPRSAGRSRPGSPHRRSRRWPRIGSLRSSRRGSLRSRRAGSIRITTVAGARQEACARIGAAGRVHDPPDLWMAGRRAATGSASHRRRGRGDLGCRRRGAFRPVVANPIPDDVRRVLPHRFEELRSTPDRRFVMTGGLALALVQWGTDLE